MSGRPNAEGLLPCPVPCNCRPEVKNGAVLRQISLMGNADSDYADSGIGWKVVVPCGVQGPWGGGGGKYAAKTLYNSIPRGGSDDDAQGGKPAPAAR